MLRSEVSQDCRLIPADFHILFNGLHKAVISQIIKFADDTKISGVFKTQRDARIILTLTKWAQRWDRKLNRYSFNVMKTDTLQ